MKQKGLTQNEVLELRKQHGLNELPKKEDYWRIKLFLAQFKNPLIYILFAAVIISFFLGEHKDIILILLVVIINILFGFYQEYGAHKTLMALKKILKKKCIVIRDGKRVTIGTEKLVPKDLVVIGSGDRIPADGELIEGANILVNESILTGESAGIRKNAKGKNRDLYMGTTILSGIGLMRVEKIGAKTEMGKIGSDLKVLDKGQKTPLQIRFEKFTKRLSILVLILSFALYVLMIIKGGETLESLKVAVILAVATIPEALPVAVTVLMSIGMKRILKRKGLVKKLLSLETLGSTSVICTDKTGTLTKGKMKVVNSKFTDKDKALLTLNLTNDRRSSLEIATWNFVKQEKNIDPEKVIDKHARVYEDPFDSEKKYILSINKVDKKDEAFLAGAPEIVMGFCNLDEKTKKEYLSFVRKWAKKGLKIIGVSTKKKGDLKKTQNFEWLGIVALEDPIREGVKDSIKNAIKAGIEVKIVTGDYMETALKVAKEIGLKTKNKSTMNGDQLAKIKVDKLNDKIKKINIFARVTPHQKLKIIKALQQNDEVVAMTGDGVNDALALKKADIGIAMNNASDVSKEASDLILLNGDFTTIMAACEEGRLIFSNIKKLTGYVLSDSFVEVFVITLSIFMGLPLPMTMLQILWIQFVCDVPLDIALGFEPKDKKLMKKRPKEIKEEKIIEPATRVLVFFITFVSGIASILLFKYYLNLTNNIELSRTVVYATVASITMLIIFSYKNPSDTIIRIRHLFENIYLPLMSILGFILLIITVHIPLFNKLISTVPLNLKQWGAVIGTAALVFISVEIFKHYVIRILVKKKRLKL